MRSVFAVLYCLKKLITKIIKMKQIKSESVFEEYVKNVMKKAEMEKQPFAFR